MFQITFQGEYKSLTSFTSDNLEDFTVITGKNGSGKSQLIELIQNFSYKNLKNEQIFEFSKTFKRIQIEGIITESFSSMGNTTWKNKVEKFYDQYSIMSPSSIWLNEILSSQNIPIGTQLMEEDLSKLSENIISELKNITQMPRPFLLKGINQLTSKSPKQHDWNLFTYIASYRKKHINELIPFDFFETPIPIHLLSSPVLPDSQVDYIFFHYAKMRDLNSRKYFEKEKYNRQNDAVSDEEFDEKYPTPWEQINEILESHKINFRFQGVSREEYSEYTPLKFPFINTNIDKPVEFSSLSSGERVIIGLITKVFASEIYTNSLELPDLLILDEPDAHLHPEMSKLLISVLHETFVKKLGIRVIMTTHSPSTIAFCPEDSIYQLSNHPTTNLKKISKDEALEILTGFLPTLSIDYKNHKQVFTESPTDVKYYQAIFDKLSQHNHYHNKLYFISNAMGKGNCDSVMKIVEDIRKSGSKTSYGIIDWDLKNQSTEWVKVHGQGERYSIENFIYDPIYFMVLFMEKNAHNAHSVIGKDHFYNHYSIESEDNATLQKACDWFFEEFMKKNPNAGKQEEEFREIHYYNDKKINVPKWYIEYNGHNLETQLKKTFQVLEKYENEGSLQQELIKIMIKCYPLISKTSVDLIEDILLQK